MPKKIQLEVLGLTFSQSQLGGYALVLGEVDGMRRLPIVIGQSEAQSIAIHLQGLKAPRPLAHDFMIDLMTTFGISLREVYIYKLEKDIFYSELHCCRNINDIRTIDARTSDAIALAVRTNCPIYIEESIFNATSVVFNPENVMQQATKIPMSQESIETASVEELQKRMQEAINIEDYETATKIRDEMKKRNG